MSYCSKEVAIALNQVGFDEPTYASFNAYGDFEVWPEKDNHRGSNVSAPDHLTAADWFWKKHKIEIAFRAFTTFVFEDHSTVTFSSKDRDAALLHACTILKERK